MNKIFEQININVEQVKELEYLCKIMPLPRGFGFTIGNVIKDILINKTSGICATAIRIKEGSKFVQETSEINECMEEVTAYIKEIRPLQSGTGIIVSDKKNVQFTTDDIEGCKLYPQSHFLFSCKGLKKLSMEILFEQGHGYSEPKEGYIYIPNSFSPILTCNIHVSDLMIKGITTNNLLEIRLRSKYPINCKQVIKAACEKLCNTIKVILH